MTSSNLQHSHRSHCYNTSPSNPTCCWDRKQEVEDTESGCTIPGVGGDLAEVSDAALGHMTSQDGGGETLRQVSLPMILL